MRSPGALTYGNCDAVFFDLDGTLVDTAPDMVAVLNRMTDRHGREAVAWDVARNNVSNGSIGLLNLAFPGVDEKTLQTLVAEYLDDYAESLCVDSDVFAPLRDLLETLDKHRRAWGVVTNKPSRMTDPLLYKLGIGDKAACIVSGDTLAERKPHPAPLLHAANVAGVAPEKVIYVGDAARDVAAGRAAGMATVAVGYGYISDDDDPLSWGADDYAADTMSLIRLVERAVGARGPGH